MVLKVLHRPFSVAVFLQALISSPFIFIISVISFMQGIDNYIPETNHASSVCNFVTILHLQFMVQVMLFSMLNVSFFYISTLLLLLRETGN